MILDLNPYATSIITGTFTLLGGLVAGLVAFLISRQQIRERKRQDKKQILLTKGEKILENLDAALGHDDREKIGQAVANACTLISIYFPDIVGECRHILSAFMQSMLPARRGIKAHLEQEQRFVKDTDQIKVVRSKMLSVLNELIVEE